jgi:amino acid adenylation domain-containing protein
LRSSQIDRLFSEQARRTPHAVALVSATDDASALTYGELDRRSDRLARRLAALGVRAEVPVGLRLDRSLERIVAMLAILKAGGVYVPLDPGYPEARLDYIVRDTGARIVITAEAILSLDSDPHGAELDPAGPAGPDGLAYVMYTSGSTGQPKGVAVRHRSVVALVTEQDYAHLGPDEVLLQLAPFSFDASTFEIWGALLNGGRLVVPPPGPVSLAGIGDLIARYQVTTLWLSAGLFHQMVEADLGSLRPLRQLLAGGDVLSVPRCRRVLAGLPGTRLINGYGPTESTTFTCCGPLTDPAQLDPSVPLGFPIAGTTLEILGPDLQPVPAGEMGEILIGGLGLARGYLGRPELTAERFLPHPLGAPGERLYRTLDLARRRPSGEIEFLGRIDGQVKVRGFRIEPEEVEAALLEHPRVRDAAVLVREDHLGEKQLAACVVMDEQSHPEGELREREGSGRADLSIPQILWVAEAPRRMTLRGLGAENPAAELRRFLRIRLPEHMIPTLFLPVAELPLTANDKVDRRALARPELWEKVTSGMPEMSDMSETVRHPRHLRHLIAELVAGIWADVLGCRQVGIHEHFLELGGHSLQATRVISRLRSALGVDVPVAALLDEPTLGAFAARVEQALAEGRPVLPALEPLADANGQPLSSAQRRLWFLDRLTPGSPAHNIPLAIDLAGPLAPAVLALSLGEIAARHEAMRTTVDAGAGGEPVQIVGSQVSPSELLLPLVDLSGLIGANPKVGEGLAPSRVGGGFGGEDGRGEIDRLSRAEARRAFDLAPGTREPLWRAVLLRTSDTAHRLLITFHHTIVDGESLPVLERELAAIYPALLAGRPSPLEPLAVQPAAVAAWERRWLTPEILAPHLAYFREQLAGAPAALDLPADRPHPPLRTWHGVSAPLALPAVLDGQVRELARRGGATAFMVLLAAWVAFLRRVTGQDDVITGSVLAHRGRPEIEDLIGFFVNTLPLRIARSGDLPFSDLLDAVRAGALGLYAHQDLPLENLIEELRPGAALFQSVLALHSNLGPRELAPGLSMQWREMDTGAAQFDLLLDLEERRDGLAGRLVGSADLFEPATMERLARIWERLLAGVLERPDARLSEIVLLSTAERQTLLVDWGRAPEPPVWNDRNGSVPARIVEWARTAPSAIAVLPADPAEPPLTYGDLAARATRLARHLRARGVGRDVRVGVYAERTPETLIGMLAVLLAGGAFLPLDPSFPPERLALILDDARVPVLLARRALAATLPTGGAEAVLLDGELPDGPEALEEIDPADLAYVIYTSGSTGRPKGVLLPHRGFLWAVEGLAVRSRLEPGSRVLQTASPSFDASVWETWSTLIHGATLVLARREELLPGAPLLATLRDRAITSVFLPPSALAAMPDGASQALSGLGNLVVGGEASSPDLVSRWAPGRRLWNAYGPTEASICATMALLGEDGQTPIGRPIADNHLLVLGRRFELQPQGVTGELHLGGRGLARGYLGRPDLTAAVFVPDPFSGEPGARLYRTGDLARFRPDGQLEFLGRADHQVKVRGFRVELGEIEAQIAEHPDVREVAVVAYEAGPRDLRLAAYVVVGPHPPNPPLPSPPHPPGEGSGVRSLRAFLRDRLPEHMVPSSFTLLAAMPLAPSGKIDRRALPPPAPEEEASASPTALRTPTEELLAGIWAEVLGRTEIPSTADFFDLGGHSLLIGQVLARVRAAFGVELPVRAAFEARTLAALARRIDEELRAVPEGGPRRPGISRVDLVGRVDRAEPLPLSFAQQRLWFLDRLEPGSPVYNLPVALRLTGPLDPAALERGLNEVFRRHEALRTTFAEGPDGEPRQIVAPFRPAALPQVDLSGLPPDMARAEASRQSVREARRPFDLSPLSQGPVARTLLLRLGEQEHHLLLAFHHIAFDGWSVEVLRRELSAFYSGSSLAEPAFQYGDFAVWQRRWLSGDALAAQIGYWRERLAGAPPVLELPADRPRPPVQSFRGATLPLAVPPALAAGLRGLARSESATLFMTALAAFAALLSRFTGQKDLVLGSPVANRTEAGIENLIGFFVNTLALRTDLTGDPPFRALLGQVRESALSAYAHQDLPFERLVEELHPERDLSRSPLFQVMFSLDPVWGSELAPGLGCELLRIDTGTAKFDLSLFLSDEDGGLTALLEYASDLFDPATVARLGRSFLDLASGLTDKGAGLRISELPLLGAGELWQILGEWNEPAFWPPTDACLHDLVAAQAERTPSAVAVIGGSGGTERLTYRDLGARAGELARLLAALGVAPEVRVGVCLPRTPALVVTLLGILEAGGVYVPLDPSYPRERLKFMLEDAGATVIVTESALADRLPPSRAHVLRLDGAPGASEIAPAATPTRAIPGNLAYLIYTSGSTGRPKAVAIEHRSAMAFIQWAQGVFDPAELASVLAATSISFDLSVFELFVPLASGGQVILAENALALPELPAAGEVVLVNTVPSAMTELVRAGALPAGVRSVNLAGEPLKGSLAQALYASGVERVRNLYGPSEDTTYSTFEVVEKGSRREPTIGRPIAGTWARLLDPDLRLVPVGARGEIYLGGAGLARGYLGRPELTAERFVPDPLANESGGRLYRTGDLGRYLPDGRIEYLGRLDHQVKVRGFRIELGEIEAALLAHPGVREAVVVALGEPGGDRSLAAWFVASGEPAPTAADLRAHLRGRLTEPMVPAHLMRLDRLPLTPNGKVDRKALPMPEKEAPRSSSSTDSTDPVTELLAGIWAEVLDLDEPPGANANFFELGGHSLLATRVVSRVRAALGVELPLRAIFAAPTVKALAAVLSGMTARDTTATPIERAPERSGLPLSFAQQRLWLLDRLEPGSPVYNLALAYRVRGPLEPAFLERALGEVVRRHEVLRTTFEVPAGSGEPRLSVAAPGPFSLPRVDLAGLPLPIRAAAAERLTGEEAAQPFDLAAGPLFRALLLTAGAAENILLVTMHHIAGDGWSLDVLLGELSALYQGSPLPELAIQYADFAAWQRRWLTGPLLESQLAYWRRQLAGAPEALDLPTDHPRPPVETSRGAHRTASLPPALVAAVRALSRRQGATLFMVLLAAFASLLERYTGEPDVLVGTPVANRGRKEIEGLIGFFVNTLVLRADLAGDPGFDTLVARVRDAAFGAYAHEDLPFERLVEELQPQRSLARSPLFQVELVLGVGEGGRELAPGLTLTPIPVENKTAKYDLTLGLDALEGGLIATWEYRTDLFEPSTIDRWRGHFEALLEAIVARPEERLSALPILAGPERQILLHDWNDTDFSPPSGLIHELFEQQARRTPEATALVTSTARLTYSELNAAADRLAGHLLGLGIGPEMPVAVCLDRSADLVIALFAILKAGGAYVPIDPAYPEERRQFLLADSGATVAITRESLLPLLAGSAARPVCLDLPLGGGAPLPADGRGVGEGTGVRVSPRNLAYLIYTSGSTGRPKGVAIEHRSAVALIHWARSVFPPEDLTAVLAATSICFDLSVFEIFIPLSWGGSIHLADNALALAESGADGLTLINTVPSAMAELVNLQAVPPTVRTVNLAGEPLPRALVDRIYELGTVERVLNLYGPSEDTTYSTWAAIPRDTPAAPSIGRPVSGTRAYLVDRRLGLAPLGVPGEVVLAGAGLARGYHGRPDLTAERFIPDPFAAEPGGRLYRTGDLARHLPGRHSDEIDFLGRIDHQVKVRGFRIELGEVEAVLASHPAVERAVVGTHSYGPQDLRLVAWVVAVMSETLVEPEALRAWVGERLPEFMVPSAVVVLPALPLTPNGKVDRRALPPPAAPVVSAGTTEPRRTPLEELISGLWTELLSCGRVGLHDDFFTLGGHSLLAIRMLAALRAATGVDLTLRTLFAHPTVATLAAEVERTLRAPGSAALPPIEATGSLDAPTSAAQERLWLFHQLDAHGSVLNVPHALRLTGPLDPSALAAAIQGIASRHASLRTTFAYGDAGLRQHIAPPTFLSLPIADLSTLPPERRDAEARRVTEEDARQPFDLAAGPLWRARLLRLDGEEHRLLLTFHHIIVDGWSLEIFDREMGAGYQTPVARTVEVAAPLGPHPPDPPLPSPPHPPGEGGTASLTVLQGVGAGAPLPADGGAMGEGLGVRSPGRAVRDAPLQYTDFAAWQRRWLTAETLAPQLAWWRRQLAGMPPVLDLPGDRPRPARQSFRGGARELALSPELSAGIKELGRREGSTLFMTVFAAFAALLGRYTGRTDVVLGSPSANRHRPGTEGMIGFFVDNLVLRLDLGGDPSFRELLRRSREVALGAYANPDLPFERLVEELDPGRDKSRNALVQVLLLVQPAPAGPLRLSGDLTAEPVEVHTATSQFDLTLAASDGPQGLTLAAEYSTDLFDAATIERLLQHFSLLLAAAVANPDLRLSGLPAEIAPRPAVNTDPTAGTPAGNKMTDKPPADDRANRQAAIAASRSKLSPEQQALLQQRLRARTARPDATQAAPPPPPPVSASLVAIQPAGSRPPFFCVHPAGGDVLCFQALSQHLGTDQPFYGLQSRGLGAGEEPLASITEMAASYRAEITQIAPGPYYLGGWSLGGAVVFELARQLAAEGKEVALLAIVDGTPGPWPPGEAADEGSDDDDNTRWLIDIADYLHGLWGLDLGLSRETLQALPPDEQERRFLAGLKDTPFGAGAGVETLRRLLRVFKTNVRAFRQFRPHPYSGKVTLFRPEANGQADPALGWAPLTPRPVDIETVPGDHITALAEPHVRALAARLRARIDRPTDRIKETRQTS